MTKSVKTLLKQLLAFAAASSLAGGCGLIDDDLSECGVDFEVEYELELVTNLETELETQLSLAADVAMSNALRGYLRTIFTDFAHDVDLSFYGVEADSLRLKHMQDVMDANQTSYSFYIPARQYMHLAAANIIGNGAVGITDSTLCHKSRLHQEIADTLSPHRTGLFTARLPMDVYDDRDQHFDVKLYMANCATALVVDTLGSGIRDIRVVATGFATDFKVCDSTYYYNYTPVFKPDKLVPEEGGPLGFVTVNFPSRDPHPTKVVIETTDPFISQTEAESLWQWRTYCTLKNGTVVETRLGVLNPLRAGQFRVFKVKVYDNGSVQPSQPDLGVSVAIEWNYQDMGEIPLG